MRGKMNLGGMLFGNKPIAPEPLSRGVIAISARLSTPPGTSTIIMLEPKRSRLPRHYRWGFGS
jgi:hypothetical protein